MTATIAIVDLATDAIATFYDDAAPNQGKFGGSWGWSSSTVYLALPAGLDRDVARAVKQADGSYTFEIDADKQAAKVERKWASLRADRNARLAACDWTQLADVNLDADAKAAWAAYRLALRHLPSTVADIDNIVWPLDPNAPAPVVTDPVVTDPVVTDPVVTDPVVTDPVVTDPVVTDPVVTDPVA